MKEAGHMKRTLALLLALVMLAALTLPALAQEAEEVIAIYGGASNKNRAKLKTMGQQNWYMMYSTMTNAGENMDLSTFAPCAQTETGMWKPAETVTIPSLDPAQPDAQVTYAGDWFSIRKDGFIAGDTGFSAAIKWVCPTDGLYDIQVSYSGGTSLGGPLEGYYQETDGSYIPAVDGVYMLCYIKGEMMFCVDSYPGEGNRVPQTELTYNEVDLKTGDEVWLVSDTKANGGWDDPWWYCNITRTGDLPAQP